MFYPILKLSCRILFRLLYHQMHVNGKQLQRLDGPTLIVANHPNSLLDALLIGTYCNKPVHFIVRSDMFNKPVIRRLLKWLNGIPVYRIIEEKHKLRENLKSFEYCKKILQQNGVILFFGEGKTVHDWNLKPMRSGLTRLLDIAMEDALLKKQLKIIPAAVNYSKYQCLLKAIHIDVGPALQNWQPNDEEPYAAWKKRFHQQMFNALSMHKYQTHSDSETARMWWETCFNSCGQIYAAPSARAEFLHSIGKQIDASEFHAPAPKSQYAYPFYPLTRRALVQNQLLLPLLAIPTVASLLLNGIPYLLIRWFCKKFLKATIFYDSVLTVAVLLLMPLWWLKLFAISYLMHEPLLYWLAPAAMISGYISLHGWKVFFIVWNYMKSNSAFRTECKTLMQLSNSGR